MLKIFQKLKKINNKCWSFLFILGFLFLPRFSQAYAGLINPLAKNGASEPVYLTDIFGGLVKSMLGLVGILSLVYFMIGGYYFLTAGGKEDRIKKGQSVLTWASIGMVLAFISYAFINYVITSFQF